MRKLVVLPYLVSGLTRKWSCTKIISKTHREMRTTNLKRIYKRSSRLVVRLSAAALIFFCALPANAVSISVVSSFNPSDDMVSTSIFAENLGNHMPPSVGAFDINFSFKPDVLTLNRVQFTSLLGDPDVRVFTNNAGNLVPSQLGAGSAISGASFLGPGTANFSEISLLEANAASCVFCTGPYLDDLQPSRVFLVGLGFHGLVDIPNVNPDRLGLALSVNGLSDAFGNALGVDSITFSPVPAPSTSLLIAGGLLAMISARIGRKSGPKET